MDTQQQPLQGRLEDVHFSEILLTISQRKESGVLHVVRHRIEKDVYFNEGRIVFAKSNDPDERLGEVVLKTGKVKYRDLDECSSKVVPGLRLGTILVQEGYLKASDLYLAVIQQVEEIVYSLFDWSDGNFAFRSGELPTKEVITLSISTPDVILKGIKRVWRWSWVRDWVGPLNTVYVRRDNWESHAKKMSIMPEIQAIIDILEQPRLLEEILDTSSLSNFETCKLLWALSIIGLIQPAMSVVPTLQMPLEPEVTSDIFASDVDHEEPAPWPHDNTPPFARQIEAEDSVSENVPVQEALFTSPVVSEEKAEERVEPPIESAPAQTVSETEKREPKIPPQILPQEMEKTVIVPAAEIAATLQFMKTMSAAPVEVSFSDLAEAAQPEVEESIESNPISISDRWEEKVGDYVKNFNELHRFLFEMLRMEMGSSIGNFLGRILNKAAAHHPLVFDGVQMNEFGELNPATLESNIQGNSADKYPEAFDFLLQEERQMMQSFLDRKRADAIESGLNRILEKQKLAS